jgi:polyhydroxyalkanoate synthesis repressor PhaR
MAVELDMAEPIDSEPKRLEIKKYPNRRYYDATHSRHLTLEEIRSLIQQGYDIRVTDAKTSADITAQVLTQIILELDTPKLDSLPVALLLRLIRMSDPLVKDFIEKYFNQALKSFTDYQHQAEKHIRRAQGLPSGLPSVSAWTKAMFEPFASAFPVPKTDAGPNPEPAHSGENEEVRELVRELQEQVAELKRARTGAQKPRRRR